MVLEQWEHIWLLLTSLSQLSLILERKRLREKQEKESQCCSFLSTWIVGASSSPAGGYIVWINIKRHGRKHGLCKVSFNGSVCLFVCFISGHKDKWQDNMRARASFLFLLFLACSSVMDSFQHNWQVFFQIRAPCQKYRGADGSSLSSLNVL